MFLTFILLTITSFAVTLISVPLTIRIAQKFRLIDDAKRRPHPAHTHTGRIPRAGGLPIFLGLLIPIILFMKINTPIVGILMGSLVLVLVGLWDDRKHRSPYVRFIFNCLSALFVIGAGVSIPYITNPFGGIINFANFGYLGQILALLWIVWMTNIIGWSGGVDGQLPGFVSISAVVIGLLSLRYFQDQNQHFVSALSFLTAGAYLGFLPWNFYPQKIMPGYGGKTLAGFLLSTLAILSYAKFGTALLVLAVPMTDAAFILTKRFLTKKSVVAASSGHLHHHLLKLGWGKRRIALFYWSISLIAGFLALVLSPKMKLFALLLIIMLIFSFILWINFFKKLPEKKSGEIF